MSEQEDEYDQLLGRIIAIEIVLKAYLRDTELGRLGVSDRALERFAEALPDAVGEALAAALIRMFGYRGDGDPLRHFGGKGDDDLGDLPVEVSADWRDLITHDLRDLLEDL